MKKYNYCIYIEDFYQTKEKILSSGENKGYFTIMKEYLNYVKKLKFDRKQIDRIDFDDIIEYNTIDKKYNGLWLEIQEQK